MSGESSFTGFEIKVHDPKNKKNIILVDHTKNYDNGSSLKKAQSEMNLGFFKFLGYIGMFIILLALPIPLGGNILWNFLILMLYVFMLVRWFGAFMMIIVFIKFPSVLKKWHGCEHKLIRLYREGLARTRENLIKARRESPRCGTGLFVSMFTLPFYFMIVLLFITSFLHLMLLIFFMLFTNKFLTYAVQRFLTTQEPDEEQINEALRFAAELDLTLQREGLI